MAATYTRQFKIRQYECDQYNHLNNSNYVRFMQEAAIEASADIGWSIERYNAVGYQWIIRSTDIEYLQQAKYGQTLAITTWVADFRRVRSMRVYEVRIAGSDELIARGSTDWIFVDTETNQPAAIPENMVNDFWPDGPPPAAPKREKLPAQPAPPPGVFQLSKRVEWRDVDMIGHLNNAAYFSYLEDCSTQVSRHYNWPMQRMVNAGFAIIARRQRIEYLQPALLDDQVNVATWVSDARRVTAVRHYTLRREADNTLLARGRALWVWVDLATMKPIRIPEDFIKDFTANIV